jgi:hypothetical protein
VIKRGAIIGIGTVILVIGLTGLGLLQTGVIYPTEEKSLETAPATGQQSPGPVAQTAPPAAPAPQSGVSPGTKTGAEPGVQGPRPPSADLSAEKPLPVPQAGKGERRYPKQDQFVQSPPPRDQVRSRPSQGVKITQKLKLDDNRRQARLKSELKRNAAKSEAKRHAAKSQVKRSTAKAQSRHYAGKTPAAHTAQPVVIRFNFDPAQHRNLNVAQVHLGDKIRVKLQQVGQVDRMVYFTYSSNINSQQGAVLKLETMYSFQRPVTYRADRGYYVVEVKIYPGNRWNIKPRRFV